MQYPCQTRGKHITPGLITSFLKQEYYEGKLEVVIIPKIWYFSPFIGKFRCGRE